MKRISIFIVTLLVAQMCFAGNGETNGKSGKTDRIHWMTLEQAEKKMKEQPRKILVDVYTDWCGWCKVMAKKTYTNPDLIKYVNKNFYAVKFDAEQKRTIHFADTIWQYDKKYKVNDLAISLLHGRMSYPTTIFILENFKMIEPTSSGQKLPVFRGTNPVPGYMKVPMMESLLKFFGENIYLHEKWQDYKKDFKSTWTVAKNKK